MNIRKTSNVSVIMCLYKSDTVSYFEEAVESMLSQSYKCDVLIYRDGEVPSELQSLLDKYSNYENVNVFESDSNKGLAYGLNYLIERSLDYKYDYIARMDSDDISLPERIKKQVTFLDLNKDVDILGCACHEFGASYALHKKQLPETHDELAKMSITRCPLIHPTVVFRSRVFNTGIRYPVDTSFTEDMALWYKLLLANYRFHNIPDSLLNYRLNENTIQRRLGFAKGISETKIRLSNMFKLNSFNLIDMILIMSRLIFHILPLPVVKFLYKKMR